MGNYFEIHYNTIKYPIDSEKSRGLRNAQLGAIHAISSFFTLNKKDAAIVIMPIVFCNADDVAYGNMHSKLSWERKKTLGRGNDCCDFILKIKNN